MSNGPGRILIIPPPNAKPWTLCAMLMDIPKYIDGAKPLYISKSDTGFGNVVRNDAEILIKYICVCQYDNEGGFYLFGCDKEFNAHIDFYYDDLDEALNDANRIYQTDNIEWTHIN